jgi:hypothetical protein
MSDKRVSNIALTDSRNMPLQIGQRVAYNLSGEIASGVIEQLIEGEEELAYPGAIWMRVKKWPCIHIRPDSDFVRLASKKGYSNVRNPKGVLIIS